MKKVLSLIVVLCMLFSVAAVSAGAADYALAIHNNVAVMAGNTNAIANNRIVQLPAAPVIVDSRMLVPVRFAAEAFNGTVEWNAAKKEISINFGNERKVQMIIGNKNISVDGQVYVSDVAPQIIDGSTMLPVNFLATTVLGRYVYYDDAIKMAVITTRKCVSERDTDTIATIAGALTSGVLPEIVIQAALEGGVSGAMGGSNAETGKLAIASVYADQEPEPDNNAQCMIDGSTGTRWASQGSATATVDLGSAKPVTHIRVAVWKPSERNTNYSLEVSANGSKYTKIFDGASSGSTYDSYDVNDTIRYVKISPNGTSAGDWASILELEVWNGTAAAAAGTVKPVSVTVDQEPEPDNGKNNVFDDDLETRWACEGTGTLIADLGSAMNVSSIELNFWKYSERTTNYTLQVSSNGSTYTTVYSGSSALGSQFDVRPVNQSVRYIKFIGNGTSTGTWTSLNEMVIKTSGGSTAAVTTPVSTGAAGSVISAATGTKETITSSAITVSQEPEMENDRSKMIDGSSSTVWASQGEANAVFDLGSAKTVSCVGVAMKMYEDDRTIPYDIEVSADGISYTKIWSGSSDPATNATKYVSVGASARYVRITAYGNTISGWNSVAEVEIYTGGTATTTTATTTTTTTTAGNGSVIAAATGTKITLSSSAISVSQEPEMVNDRSKMIDGSSSTVWASQGEANAVFDLGSAKTVSCVGVGMKMYEDDRTIPYDIEVSADGISYTKVWSGSSDAFSNDVKYVSVGASARYVRITAYGNTVSGWNSVAEVEIYAD